MVVIIIIIILIIIIIIILLNVYSPHSIKIGGKLNRVHIMSFSWQWKHRVDILKAQLCFNGNLRFYSKLDLKTSLKQKEA